MPTHVKPVHATLGYGTSLNRGAEHWGGQATKISSNAGNRGAESLPLRVSPVLSVQWSRSSFIGLELGISTDGSGGMIGRKDAVSRLAQLARRVHWSWPCLHDELLADLPAARNHGPLP